MESQIKRQIKRHIKRDVIGQTEIHFFDCDLSDDVLERAASLADGPCISVGACTHWYYCGWPLSPGERAASQGQRQPTE